MKVRFLYLNIFFAIIYSVLTILTSNTFNINTVIKVIMMSAAVIFVGYILDSKTLNQKKKN